MIMIHKNIKGKKTGKINNFNLLSLFSMSFQARHVSFK